MMFTNPGLRRQYRRLQGLAHGIGGGFYAWLKAKVAPGPAGPLPYQEGLEQAGRSGTVLHREDIYSSGPPIEGASEEVLAFVLAHVGDTALDVGCGAGSYVAALNAAGKRCVGIDLDPVAVEAARMRHRPVMRMSATALAFPDKSFDSVVMIETLEHLPDFEGALREVTRVARRNLIITVPDISVLPIMSKRGVVPWHLLEATHVNFFTPESLRKTLLRFAPACHTSQLGIFFWVDGKPVRLHIAAVAHLSA